ncbi:MAG: hydroxymethylbilane synthase, partial [Deltaproteobacteria bacterium]|nr:hydroxymethylbilane synthase [Deltaproteobacteria bacterium]
MKNRLVIGSRGSPLSQAQTALMVRELSRLRPGLTVEVKPFRTSGDDLDAVPDPELLGLKGLFVREIEKALLAGEIDLAVHSAKDLPQVLPEGLALGPVPARGPAHDVLISLQGYTLENLPPEAKVGTSSLRRQALLLAARPDLVPVPIRGNLGTRLEKLRTQDLTAVILAAAGLSRLELFEHPQSVLPPETFLPAPGQGTLALEYSEKNSWVRELLEPLNDPPSATALALERGVTFELGSGCRTPAAAWAKFEGGRWHLRAMAAQPDGRKILRAEAYL